MESDLEEKLIAQKRSITSVEGNPPGVALGCVASFPPASSTLRVDAFDPTSDEIEQVAISVDFDQYILAYYEPFIAAIDTGAATVDEESSNPYTSAEFQSFRLRVGVLRPIERRVRAAMQGELAGLAQDIQSVLDDRSLPHASDGTLVEADWEQAVTTNDWEY